MATFVTLVHGTFARRAGWIKPDSKLSKYLIGMVAPPVHLTPFTWSGANRISARLKAAEDLRRRLLDQVGSHPNDAHYVIGHSHGGNVAAYAIQGSEELKRTVGLVCLSTPFLLLELRALSISTRKMLTTLRLALFGFLLAGISNVANDSPRVAVAAISVCVFCSTALWKTRREGMLRSSDRVAQFIAKANVQGLDPRRVLLVRSDGDEASLTLALAQSLTLGADFLSSFCARYLTPPSWALNLIIVALLMVLGFLTLPSVYPQVAFILNWGLIAWIIKHLNDHGIDWDSLFGRLPDAIYLVVLVPLIAVIVPLMMVILPLGVAGVLALAAGFDLLRYQPFLRSSIEASPRGGWQVHLFPVGSPTFKGLRHSRSWEDPRVHRLIGEWIAAAQPEGILISTEEPAPELAPQAVSGERSRHRRLRFGDAGAAAILLLSILATIGLNQQRIYERKLRSVLCIGGTSDGKSLWAVGYQGLILHSIGGTNWKVERSGIGSNLNSISTGDGRRLWAVSDSGKIVRSVDGEHWTAQQSGTSQALNSVFSANDGKDVWAVGNHGTILRSVDGEHWASRTIPGSEDLMSICGTRDGASLWAVGRDGSILHSSDGDHWIYQRSGSTYSNALFNNHSLYAVSATGDGRSLWAVGDSGEILHSHDGERWSKVETHYETKPGPDGRDTIVLSDNVWQNLYSVFAVDDGSAWAVGAKGTIAHTSDGEHWLVQSVDSTGNQLGWLFAATEGRQLTAVFGTEDGKSLWVAGPSQTLLSSSGGQQWSVP